MAMKTEPPKTIRKPISWNVYKIASEGVWLSEVEASAKKRLSRKPGIPRDHGHED
jgi:hypothetical protein